MIDRTGSVLMQSVRCLGLRIRKRGGMVSEPFDLKIRHDWLNQEIQLSTRFQVGIEHLVGDLILLRIPVQPTTADNTGLDNFLQVY
jgi:uncharacterized metal-binding protein YceD (DUF177 family)